MVDVVVVCVLVVYEVDCAGINGKLWILGSDAGTGTMSDRTP